MRKTDGDYHGEITMAIAGPIAVLSLAALPLSVDLGLALFWCAAGCYSGLFIDPDLDQMHSESRVRAYSVPVLGLILGPAWQAYWGNYSYRAKHRSFWTHYPVVSTAIRVIYMIPGLIGLGALLRGLFGVEITIDVRFIAYATSWFVGLCLSDIGHYGRDTRGWQIK